MATGVTSTGFVSKSQEDITAEITSAVQAAFGASFDCTAESPMGQIIGIVAERLAEIWEVQEETYAAFTADGATGQALDDLCGLTGTVRDPPKSSTVTAHVTGTNGTVIPLGTLFAVANIGTQFRTTEAATISGGVADIPCESADTGPKIAASGTLTVIVTPVGGLSTVTNSLDAVLGSDLETDADLRVKRENELRAQGAAAVEAIRDSILHDVADVTACTVFENPTDVTDGDGLPPHSIECLVAGGDDQDIADKIWEEKAAGIQTHGTSSETVTDSQGNAHTVNFSRPSLQNIYVTYDLIIDPLTWSTNGVAQVKAAAVAYGVAALIGGKDVVASALVAPAFSVAGVLDAPAPKIGTSPSPGTTTTIVINQRQQAILDTSRIVVNTTNGTP
jgi:uncharacterized phage protein gp47/JayE